VNAGPVSGDLAAIKAAIRTELKVDGCTQKDLARYLGISEKHVSQVLTGKVAGHLPLIERMAQAVGLSLLVTATHPP
jgi:transcriptional regulator with XRE-family HTH domain